MRLNKYEVFQHIYFEMQDLISEFIRNGYLTYCPQARQYSYSGSDEAWDNLVNGIFVETQERFALSKKMTGHYRRVFSGIFDPSCSYLKNRLFFGYFSPIIMSPMVMMFMVSRLAIMEFKNTAAVSLDLVFEDLLLAHNAILTYPLDKQIINSMLSSFQNDDHQIKGQADSWVALVANQDPRNKGFIWHNNTEYCILTDRQKAAAVYTKLFKGSYFSMRSLSQIVFSYRFSNVPLDVKTLRWDILGFNYTTLSGSNKAESLDFCGVGVVALLLQGMVNGLYLIPDRRLFTKHIMSVEDALGCLMVSKSDDRDYLLQFAEMVIAKEYEHDLELKEKIVSNHQKIISLIKTPSFFKGLPDYVPAYPTE